MAAKGAGVVANAIGAVPAAYPSLLGVGIFDV